MLSPFRLLLAAAVGVSAMALDLVPHPQKVVTKPGQYTLTARTAILVGKGTGDVAEVLRNALKPPTGLPLPLTPSGKGEGIALHLEPQTDTLGEEGYRLTVTPKGVTLVARREKGLFYAVQTLRQMLPPAILRDAHVQGASWVLPCAEITDAPRFSWRGSHLDVGRHFMPVSFIKRHLDLMALHKLNVFHWHLTEDQGWRLEIKKYPKLTEVGAWRKETVVLPLTRKPEDAKYDGTPHGGFYTQDDVREIVAYAAARHITVVPEIEMPGHATAAIVAYPELGNGINPPKAVPGTWGIFPTVFNTEDQTLAFLKDVLTEVLELFPSTFIHVGGDECPKEEWKASPAVQARMKALGLKDEHEMQSWFIRQMDAWLASKGRRLIGWDEILEGGLAPGAAVMSWRGEKGGIEAASAGHDVVMAPNSHTYLDYLQSKSTPEPQAFGGYIPLEKIYGYEPVPADLPKDKVHHVLGAQAQLWTEFMPNPEKVFYMTWPRLAALAEVVWSPKEGRVFQDFEKRLLVHNKRFEAMGVNYRRPEGNRLYQLTR